MIEEFKKTKNIIIIVIIILVILSVYYVNDKFSSSIPTATTTISNTTIPAWMATKTSKQTEIIPIIKDNYPSSYTNSEYNFQLRFPSYVKAQNYFTTFYNLSSNWKLNSSLANQGKAVVSLSIFKIDQGQLISDKTTYPLYFTTEVRISVSPNIQNCYTVETGYNNDGSTVINGVTFKKFSYNDNLSPNYTRGESYRTTHNNKCFVLEQIRSGSDLKNNTTIIGTTDAKLMAYYNVGESIIKTFKFTK